MLRDYQNSDSPGRQLVFQPQQCDQPLTLVFDVGQHPDCWIRVGKKSYPKGVSTFPQITLTFQWVSAEEWTWIDESSWFVVMGGIFVDALGHREKTRVLDLYLNNRLVTSDNNPELLFPPGRSQVCLTVVNRDIHSRLDIDYNGKIIILNYCLDQYATSWPADVWTGPQWPSAQATDVVPTQATPAALVATEETTGRTWADVVAIALNGPDSIQDRLWHRLWISILAFLAVLGIWLWKR